MEKVVIFGASTTADHSYFYFTHDSPYEVAAFTVDREYIEEKTRFGLPVVPFEDIETIYPPIEYKMFIALSFKKVNRVRAEKYDQAKAKGYQLVSYVSSKTTSWPGLVIGDNCNIHEDCLIQPYAEIGNNVTIGAGSLIAHHCIVGDHSYIAAHVVISGNVTVEPYSFLGANSTIRDRITIARECVIGAGALILKDTQKRGVYKGHPAILLPKPSNELRDF
jgi:sugar O-acyltransferase (sialic acid O-acetyltransferase NeuD family)